MKRRTSIVLGLLSSAIAGCGGDPRGLEYVTSRPDAAELVGRYELVGWQSAIPEKTESSKDPARGYSLVLEGDGCFVATNVPIFEFAPEDRESPRLTSASGRWELTTVGTLGSSFGADQRIWGIQFVSEPRIDSAALMVRRRLVFTLGDPDSGDGLTFSRRD